MDLIITILPVVTKDIPISPRFTPYDFFYRDTSSALLQLVNQWLNLASLIFCFLVQVAIRNIRRDAVEAVKKAQKSKSLGKDQVLF